MPLTASIEEMSTRVTALAAKHGFKLSEAHPAYVRFTHEDNNLKYRGIVNLMFAQNADGTITVNGNSMSMSNNPALDPPPTHKSDLSFNDIEELMTGILAVKVKTLADTGTVWEAMESILSASPTRTEWITACLKSHPEGDNTAELRPGRLEEWLNERTSLELSRLDRIISGFHTMSQKEQRLISDIFTLFVLPAEFEDEYSDDAVMSVLTIRDAFMHKSHGEESKFLREDMTRGLAERYELPDLSTERLVVEAVAVARFAYELHEDLHPAPEPDSYDPTWHAWRYRDQKMVALLRTHADRIDELLFLAREHSTVDPDVLESLIAAEQQRA